jgi:hypothetical protein
MEKLKSFFKSVGRRVASILWKPLEQGEERAQINLHGILILVVALAGTFTVGALIFPSQPKYIGEFREALPKEMEKTHDDDRDRALAKLTDTTQKAFSRTANGASSVNGAGGGSAANGSSGQDRNTPMVFNRPGVNSGNQLAAGVKFTVRLLDQLTIGEQAVPVIAEVTHGAFTDAGGGIKEGSRLFGMAQFQNGSERAQIQFQSISDSSGIVRPIQSMALAGDGQAGITGDVHSKSLRNATGQFVTRFVAAYAEGSQQRDFLGNSRGGAENGMLNAVAETAKDRTNAYAEDLKKEHQWIEIGTAKEFTVILTQTFTFNEPGVSQ